MPLSAPPAPGPDDPDPLLVYVTEDDIRAHGIDPDTIRVLAPHATELRALDGSRCWACADLTRLLGAEGGTP